MSFVRFQVFLFSFLLLLLCGSVAVVHASVGNRIFRHIDIRDGLSQNTVNCILQDKSGYMWFATKDGLNRYDGISFRVFKNTNSGLKCNFINTIHEAPDGNIWIGSERGLFVYDPLTESVRYVDATADDTSSPLRSPILSIMTCPSDSMVYVVASGRGVYRYNPETDVLEQQLGENSNRNVSFCSFYSDRVWLGVPNEDLYFAEINIFANNRSGVLLDITKILTENKVDILSVNSRVSKQGTVTLTLGFEAHGSEQLSYLIAKIRGVESIIDVVRTTG